MIDRERQKSNQMGRDMTKMMDTTLLSLVSFILLNAKTFFLRGSQPGTLVQNMIRYYASTKKGFIIDPTVI